MEVQRVAPVLDYQLPRTAATAAPSMGEKIFFVIASLPAAISFFLPFAWNTSPLDVLSDWNGWENEGNLELVALPFAMGFAIVAWKARLLFPSSPRRWERRIAHAVAALVSFATFALIIRCAFEDIIGNLEEWMQMLSAPTLLAAGVAGIVWLSLRRQPVPAATLALQTVYAANGVMCMLIFKSRDEPGWWLTFLAVIAIAAETVIAIVRARRSR